MFNMVQEFGSPFIGLPKVQRSDSSRERIIGQGVNWPGHNGQFASGSELARERKGSVPISGKSRQVKSMVLTNTDSDEPLNRVRL